MRLRFWSADMSSIFQAPVKNCKVKSLQSLKMDTILNLRPQKVSFAPKNQVF